MPKIGMLGVQKLRKSIPRRTIRPKLDPWRTHAELKKN